MCCRISRWAGRTFALLAAISFLLCALSLAVLARGSRDYLSWARAGGHFVSLDSVDGSLVVFVTRSDADHALRWQRTAKDSVLFPCAALDLFANRDSDLFLATLTHTESGALVVQPGVYSSPRPATRVIAHWSVIAMLAGILPLGWGMRRAWGASVRDPLDVKPLT
jgi:hypothetical protein